MVTIEKLRPSFVFDQRLEEIREEAIVSEAKLEQIQMEHFRDVVQEIAENLDTETLAEMGRLALVAQEGK